MRGPLLVLAALCLLVTALVLVRRQPSARESDAPVQPVPESVAADSPGSLSTGRTGPIRDVFRYADEDPGHAPAADPEPEARAAAEMAQAEAPAPSGLRLVGLLRRDGRLLAVISLGGDVVVVGRGDAAGDATVLAVTDESVQLRHADGHEATLVLAENPEA